MSVIIVTAADDAYFGLAWAMIASVRAAGGRSVSFGLMDLGLKSEQRASLADNNVQVVTPTTRLTRADEGRFPAAEMGYLARPFLRENFPGHEVYVWLDADSWVQDAEGYEGLAQAARQVGAAVVAETAHEYRFWPWLLGWRAKHYVFGYGLTRGIRLWLRPQINNGAFALTAGAPHWAVWQHYYRDALNRTGRAAPHDQFALNAAIHLEQLPTRFMEPTYNWICDLATPKWDAELGRFVRPVAPHRPIHVMHLAGPAKAREFDVDVIGGGVRRGKLLFGATYSETTP